MTLESTQHPRTAHRTTAHHSPVPRTRRTIPDGASMGISMATSMAVSLTIAIAGGLLATTGARAQSADAHTLVQQDVRNDVRTEGRPELRPDRAVDSQRAGGPMDSHRPGWHDHGRGPHHPMMGWMIGRLDTDRDGAISRAELEAEHKRHAVLFEQADTDHDGKVTADELRAFRVRHGRGHRAEHHREGRPGPGPQLELPAHPPQGGEPVR